MIITPLLFPAGDEPRAAVFRKTITSIMLNELAAGPRLASFSLPRFNVDFGGGNMVKLKWSLCRFCGPCGRSEPCGVLIEQATNPT